MLNKQLAKKGEHDTMDDVYSGGNEMEDDESVQDSGEKIEQYFCLIKATKGEHHGWKMGHQQQTIVISNEDVVTLQKEEDGVNNDARKRRLSKEAKANEVIKVVQDAYKQATGTTSHGNSSSIYKGSTKDTNIMK